MSLTRKNADTSAARALPTEFPEAVLGQAATAWLQVLRNDSWDPASVRILTVHLDGQGVCLESPIPLPRTTKIMVNITLRPQQSIHMQGVVHATIKNGLGCIAVVRFENQANADKETLAEFATAAPAPEQPVPTVPDKRRYRRFVKSVNVQYQLLRADGEIVPGQGQMMTFDIGSGGMKIRIEQRLHAGDLLYLHLPLDSVPFFSLGRVIWIDDSRIPDRWVAGLEFVDLSESEQQRLVTLLDGHRG